MVELEAKAKKAADNTRFNAVISFGAFGDIRSTPLADDRNDVADPLTVSGSCSAEARSSTPSFIFRLDLGIYISRGLPSNATPVSMQFLDSPTVTQKKAKAKEKLTQTASSRYSHPPAFHPFTVFRKQRHDINAPFSYHQCFRKRHTQSFFGVSISSSQANRLVPPTNHF